MAASTPSEIAAAARLLEQGGLVAFPTETVYGLGADAENPAAVAAIYAAKGRPQNHPVIVHVAPGADLSHWAESIPADAHRLIAAFWPGPLTIILKRAENIPDAVSGGQDSVGLRCPSHPVAQALLREFKGGKGGLAAPSANRFGHVSPTTAQHVRDEFGDALGCVLDGGQSQVGIESTIIDLSRGKAVLLRPGDISAAQIEVVLGSPVESADTAAPRASGTLESHYAPRTPVLLVPSVHVEHVLRKIANMERSSALICHSPLSTMSASNSCQLPDTPEGYAHGLYAALREADDLGMNFIVVEAPPEDAAWQGVNDRLVRAAHSTQRFLVNFLPRK